MDDEVLQLTEAAAGGDRAAVDALIGRYLPQLRAFVRLRAGAMLRARESSSDLVQSVCREVLANMERFRHPSERAFKHWLYTTALRKIQHRRDYWRAQRRDVMREVPLDGGGDAAESEAGLLDCYHTFSTPGRKAVVREELERIESAFDQLSDEQREVITLAHLVGLSRSEIAEKMGRSEGAVRVLLHRALARLSSFVTPVEGDGEA